MLLVAMPGAPSSVPAPSRHPSASSDQLCRTLTIKQTSSAQFPGLCERSLLLHLMVVDIYASLAACSPLPNDLNLGI